MGAELPETPSTGTPALDEYLRKLRTYLKDQAAELAAARAPDAKLMTGPGTIDPSWDVVVYAGPGSEVITMPTAKRAGVRKSRPVVVMNVGPGTLTLAAQGGETLDAAATKTVATGVKYRFDADGDTRWQS